MNNNDYISPLSSNQNKKDKDQLVLSSKTKWFWLGISIALLNPVFSGVLLGLAFLSEKNLRKNGQIILAVSIVWGVVLLYLNNWLIKKGYMSYWF